MSETRYITLTPEEKNRLSEALSQDFGENRITYGAYLKMLADERIDGGRADG